MMKKLYLLSLLALLSFLAVGWVLAKAPKVAVRPTNAVTGPIFYYGDGCPHCANVEAYLKEHPLPPAFNMLSKEVYNDKKNQGELLAVAKSCGLDTSSVGIPLLYTADGKCLIGDADIIAYFKNLK